MRYCDHLFTNLSSVTTNHARMTANGLLLLHLSIYELLDSWKEVTTVSCSWKVVHRNRLLIGI